MPIIRCSDCQLDLSVLEDLTNGEPWQPCPNCGSMNRALSVSDALTVRILELVGTTQRRDGVKKWIRKTLQGMRQDRNGRVVTIERVMDREADYYRELVVYEDDGSIEVDKTHPLTEHYKHHGRVSNRASDEGVRG